MDLHSEQVYLYTKNAEKDESASKEIQEYVQCSTVFLWLGHY